MKLIVFDWDLTLWNSWDVHVRAASHAAKVVGLAEPSPELIASIFSVPFVQHMEILFPGAAAEATRHYMDFYHSRVQEEGHLYQGVPETLEALKSQGCRLGVLSDKRDVFGSKELEATGIGGYFDHVAFQIEDRPYKPDPAGLRRVLSSLSMPAEEALYVGDSHVDIQCARRTGTASAAALWGAVDVAGVMAEAPDYVCLEVGEVFGAASAGIPRH